MISTRKTDPIYVQYIWDAISNLKRELVETDLDNIIKYLNKKYHLTNVEATQIIKSASTDGLLKFSDVNKYEYRLPNKSERKSSDNDWYCFICHFAGDVMRCSTCFRVFHDKCVNKDLIETRDIFNRCIKSCIKSDTLVDVIDFPKASVIKEHISIKDILSYKSYSGTATSVKFDNTKCIICNLKNGDTKISVPKTELNEIILVIYKNISSWLPKKIQNKLDKDDAINLSTEEIDIRRNFLFFKNFILADVEEKAKYLAYNSYFDFFEDILTVRHNVAIFHGVNSQESGAAEFMLRDTLYDLREVIQCTDCYCNFNKNNEGWFVLPCRNKHQLIWAKNSRFSYWPAKVYKENGIHYDIRFFGGKHLRSLIPKSNILPIENIPESLKLKMPLKLKKAISEMNIYYDNLKKLKGKYDSIVLKKEILDIAPVKVSQKRKRKLNQQNKVPTRNTNKKRKSNANSTSEFSNLSIVSAELETSVISVSSKSDDEEKHSTEIKKLSKMEINGMQKLYSDEVKKMQSELEKLSNPNDIIRHAMDSMQKNIDKMTKQHILQISETKRKQWCRYCEQSAIYHCCWNTAYCSTTCQQHHWQTEHKKFCRRKK